MASTTCWTTVVPCGRVHLLDLAYTNPLSVLNPGFAKRSAIYVLGAHVLLVATDMNNKRLPQGSRYKILDRLYAYVRGAGGENLRRFMEDSLFVCTCILCSIQHCRNTHQPLRSNCQSDIKLGRHAVVLLDAGASYLYVSNNTVRKQVLDLNSIHINTPQVDGTHSFIPALS